jgi:subtilisin family serine protease
LRSVLEAVSWAVEEGAHVINMSLGFDYYEPMFSKVFDILLERHQVLPVVAIGNENHGNSSSPGNAPNTLAVGAVDRLPGGRLDVAAFSSGASLVFPGETVNPLVTKPDVVAPGVDIYSCIPPDEQSDGTHSYMSMDGTSAAAPHVAGVIALLLAARRNLPVREVLEVLKQTARHPEGDKHRPDNRWGFGLIQPVEALKAVKR